MVDVGEGGIVFETLEAAECHALLARGNLGRVAVSIGALPVVLPVNYALDAGAIVFRTTQAPNYRRPCSKKWLPSRSMSMSPMVMSVGASSCKE